MSERINTAKTKVIDAARRGGKVAGEYAMYIGAGGVTGLAGFDLAKGRPLSAIAEAAVGVVIFRERHKETKNIEQNLKRQIEDLTKVIDVNETIQKSKS